MQVPTSVSSAVKSYRAVTDNSVVGAGTSGVGAVTPAATVGALLSDGAAAGEAKA